MNMRNSYPYHIPINKQDTNVPRFRTVSLSDTNILATVTVIVLGLFILYTGIMSTCFDLACQITNDTLFLYIYLLLIAAFWRWACKRACLFEP